MLFTSLLFPLLALVVVLWIANRTLPKTGSYLTRPSVESSKWRLGLITTADHLLSDKRNYTPSVLKMPLCPPVPPGMEGRVPVNTSQIRHDPTAAELGAHQWDSFLGRGGRSWPKSCISRHKVAIIIPIRNREQHLRQFLRHMHPFLQKQQLDYTILAVEQTGEGKFNRGMLMNIGAVEAAKLWDSDHFDCFIFHDVDLLPEDDRNLYTCPGQPRHMSAAVDIFNYRLPYRTIFGGVCAISADHFQRINGFANSFWGWGGEDDDLANRVLQHNLTVWRYPLEYARYTMLTHSKEKRSFKRLSKIRKTKQRWRSDGLNNLKYSRKRIHFHALYTRVLVRITK